MCHERATSPEIGELIAAVEGSSLVSQADSVVAANIREARRDYDRATKLPRRLVEELSHTCTLSQQAWIGARKKSSFKDFQPWLEKIVALKREEARAIGYGKGVPYDALLDAFEPGMTAADVTRLFTPLRDELVKLIAAVIPSMRNASSHFWRPNRSASISTKGGWMWPLIPSAAASARATRG
jgi:carboxypeptidase Taq